MDPGSCPLKRCLHRLLDGAGGAVDGCKWIGESEMSSSRCRGYISGNQGGMLGVPVTQPHQIAMLCCTLCSMEGCR